MKGYAHWIAAGLAVGAMGPMAGAAIVFDDFNTDEGHFGFAPSFAGQSAGESASSAAERVTTDGPLEGEGHQRLDFLHDGSATNLRIRHLSGAAPFGSAQAGAPASNVAFTTSAGIDGFIGFYLKTLQPGYTVSLNLDGGTAGAGADMDGGTPKAVIADGTWHLYEWNLDDDDDWGQVASIGGNGTIEHIQHTVDSIYFFANATGTAEEADLPLFLDFVAKSDSGSIANMIPEPGSLALVGAAGSGLLLRRRRLA